MEQKGSKGVTIFGISLIIFPILALLACGYHYMLINKAETALGREIPQVVKEKLKERGMLEEWLRSDKELRGKTAFLKKDFKRIWAPAIVYNFILLVTAISVLRLKNWGRILAIILSIWSLIGTPFDIYNYFYHFTLKNTLTWEISAFYFSVTWIVYTILYYIFCMFLLYFFTRPKVKEQFR